MTKKNKNKKEQSQDLEKDPLSTAQVLEAIGNVVNKEKIRREKVQKENDVRVLRLGSDELVKSGNVDFNVPMSKDLATLKSLIQTIVRDELKRSQRD